MSYNIKSTSYELEFTSYDIKSMSYSIKNYELQVTTSTLKGLRCFWNIKGGHFDPLLTNKPKKLEQSNFAQL